MDLPVIGGVAATTNIGKSGKSGPSGPPAKAVAGSGTADAAESHDAPDPSVSKDQFVMTAIRHATDVAQLAPSVDQAFREADLDGSRSLSTEELAFATSMTAAEAQRLLGAHRNEGHSIASGRLARGLSQGNTEELLSHTGGSAADNDDVEVEVGDDAQSSESANYDHRRFFEAVRAFAALSNEAPGDRG